MADEPFSLERRVAFGECDPARIYFAPRAVDYAVEAVELWYCAVLGISWADLVNLHAMEARFLSVECEYLRSLSAGQTIRVGVSVAGIEESRLTLRAVAELGPGEIAFRVRLVMCLIDRAHGEVIPIPVACREAIESYRKRCGGPVAHGAGTDGTGTDGTGTDGTGTDGTGTDGTGTDGTGNLPVRDDAYLLSLRQRAAAPFARQWRVRYGDCGVSGTIYLPKLVECAIERLGEWYEWCLGISWLEQNIRKRGVPFINIRCEYLRPMTPGQVIDLVVRIPRLGRSGIGYEVIGCDDQGRPCFEAQIAACYISEENGPYQPTAFPDELRERIIAYQQACGT